MPLFQEAIMTILLSCCDHIVMTTLLLLPYYDHLVDYLVTTTLQPCLLFSGGCYDWRVMLTFCCDPKLFACQISYLEAPYSWAIKILTFPTFSADLLNSALGGNNPGTWILKSLLQLIQPWFGLVAFLLKSMGLPKIFMDTMVTVILNPVGSKVHFIFTQ